ncbi:MAG: ABC transporter permease [Clostridia bacterium]|nr:ABC transporter permease [Clostridia bacterium]
MNVAAKIVKKLLMMIPIVIMVSIILFLLLKALPGDAAMVAGGEFATDADIEAAREAMGLNKPLYMQYLDWLWGILHGDFGNSLLTGSPIVDKVVQRFPATMELAILSMIVAIIIAVPLGIISAVYRNSVWDTLSSILSVVGIAMPSFWLGMLLIILFSLTLGWLPASGYTPFFEDPIKSLRYMILPAFSIGASFAATTMRQTRNALLEVLDQDYMMTAKAKGLPGHIIIWKHALRNALIPVVTVVAMQTGKLFGGAVIAETVFVIPGLGSEIVNSIMKRDFPTTMAMIMIVAVIVIFINTFIDILYGFIDPRVGKED